MHTPGYYDRNSRYFMPFPYFVVGTEYTPEPSLRFSVVQNATLNAVRQDVGTPLPTVNGGILIKEGIASLGSGGPLRKGELLLTGGEYGWTATCSWSSLPGQIRRQLEHWTPAERTVLDVLRGAHLRTEDEISRAFSALRLGPYSRRNAAIHSLVIKGVVDLSKSSTLLVRSKRREWVERPISDQHGGWVWPDPAWWNNGSTTVENGMYNGDPWWALLGWPAYRGGRPPRK